MNDVTVKPGTGFEFFTKRTFDAPLDRVWRAWTEPELMAQWWGPKGFDCRIVKLELRPGGICHYHLTSPQGQEMWGKLLYREIVPKERMVFIVAFSDEHEAITIHPMSPGWPRQILSTITFFERDGKTTVNVHWVPYEATEAERKVFEDGEQSMQAGWSGTFDKFENHLAKS